VKEHEKLLIDENTTIGELLTFMNIDLEEFYSNNIADNINRACFWRSFEDTHIELVRK
jgi:hypothetical protein